MSIAIVDSGNVASVRNAFSKLGIEPRTIREDVLNADGLIIPGVGSFGQIINSINKEAILNFIKEGKPVFGICLGMQILFERSEESPGIPGLSIFKGEVKKFPANLPIPQMGWNRVKVNNSRIFDGIEDFYGYFANSYYCKAEDANIVSSTTDYSLSFASSIFSKNIFATQFHPEKSGPIGLKVLENFIREVRR